MIPSARREGSEQYHRDQFIGQFIAATGKPPHSGTPVHMAVEIAAALLAKGRQLHRLAEQQCNGEGYYSPTRAHAMQATGYETCRVCGADVPTRAIVRWGERPLVNQDRRIIAMRACITCRTEEQVKKLLPEGWRVRFQGDPRGAVCLIAYAPDQRWKYHDSGQWTYDNLDGHKVSWPEPRWLVVA